MSGYEVGRGWEREVGEGRGREVLRTLEKVTVAWVFLLTRRGETRIGRSCPEGWRGREE